VTGAPSAVFRERNRGYRDRPPDRAAWYRAIEVRERVLIRLAIFPDKAGWHLVRLECQQHQVGGAGEVAAEDEIELGLRAAVQETVARQLGRGVFSSSLGGFPGVRAQNVMQFHGGTLRGGFRLAAAGVQDEFGVAVRLRAALEDQVAGGGEGGAVERRRHRLV